LVHEGSRSSVEVPSVRRGQMQIPRDQTRGGHAHNLLTVGAGALYEK